MKKKPFLKVLKQILNDLPNLLNEVSQSNHPSYPFFIKLDHDSRSIKKLTALIQARLESEQYSLTDYLSRDASVLNLIFSNDFLIAVYHHLHLSEKENALPATPKAHEPETQDFTMFINRYAL